MSRTARRSILAPWWLRASDDEQLADSPAELEAFAHEEDPIVDLPPTLIVPRILTEDPIDDGMAAAAAGAPAGDDQAADDLAAGDDDADTDGDAEGGLAEAGQEAEGEAKAGGVRRRRRRRRRRAGEGAPAAAEPPAAEPPRELAEPAVAAVPLFDSPPAAAAYAAPAAPVPAAASGWPIMEPAEPADAPPVESAPIVPPVAEAPAPPAANQLEAERPAARVAPQPAAPLQQPPRRAQPPAPPRQQVAEKPAPAVQPAARSPRAPEPRIDLPYGGSEIGQMQMEGFPKTAYVYTMPERPSSPADERKIAMFVDFENIALGVRDSEVRTFDMTLILERLLEKGKIIVKKAYADWERYSEYKRPFHEAAIELIDIPQKFYSGKNSADIKMVVDAMDLCYSKEHLDTFVLVSGDSDFSPLVSKLKENNKYVIGLGVKNSSSSLLIDNCDEFIYYEDVWRDTQRVPRLDHLAPKEAECFQLMCESIVALLRENKEVLWGSLVKQTMQRKRPSFSEGYYGYGTFTELLEDAERKNIIRLRRDQRSGTYIVVGFVPPRSTKRSFQV
jgi:uncharacterized protein (TIGR00288 family)